MSIIQLLDFDVKADNRGSLVALEEMKNIPFEIKRIFYMTGLNAQYSRGYHAHKQLKQVAVCLSGSCRFILDDSRIREEIVLDSPQKGLMIQEMIWGEMHDFSNDCIIIVLANQHYDENDYIRDYDEFVRVSRL